jgi:hypothetical protein
MIDIKKTEFMALRSELHCGSVWLKIGLAAKVSEKKLL